MPGPRHLFAIGSNLEVVEVDLRTFAPTRGVIPRDIQQFFAAVRSYAFGLAASGDTRQATDILLQMPAPSPTIHSYNRRLAAAVLFAAWRQSDAQRIVEESAPIDSAVASGMTAELPRVPDSWGARSHLPPLHALVSRERIPDGGARLRQEAPGGFARRP